MPLTEDERSELYGDLRSVPARMVPALGASVLLYLAGDVGGWPAISWFALLPLSCATCRAGPVCAFLVAVVALGGAAIAQTLWLLDVELVLPGALWFAAGVIPALAFGAIELPFANRLPLPVRALLFGLMFGGCWMLVPNHELFVPGATLFDSASMPEAFRGAGSAAVAATLGMAARFVAEFYRMPGKGARRAGWWVGLAMGLGLVGIGVADWFRPVARASNEGIELVALTSLRDAKNQSEALLESTSPGAILAWPPAGLKEGGIELEPLIAVAMEISRGREITLVLGGIWEGGERDIRIFPTSGSEPDRAEGHRAWPPHAPPDDPVYGSAIHVQWNAPVRVVLWSETVHDGQTAIRLRALQREAWRKGEPILCVWKGGAAAIGADGLIAAREDAAGRLHLRLAAGRAHDWGTVRALAGGLGYAAVLIALALVGMSVLGWRRRRQMDISNVAIEEVFDDPVISDRQKKTITRRIERKE